MLAYAEPVAYGCYTKNLSQIDSEGQVQPHGFDNKNLYFFKLYIDRRKQSIKLSGDPPVEWKGKRDLFNTHPFDWQIESTHSAPMNRVHFPCCYFGEDSVNGYMSGIPTTGVAHVTFNFAHEVLSVTMLGSEEYGPLITSYIATCDKF